MGFHRFLKKDRKEKLFGFVGFVEVEGVVLGAAGRRDLDWVKFSVIAASGEGLSMLDRRGIQALICIPFCRLSWICSNCCEMRAISS